MDRQVLSERQVVCGDLSAVSGRNLSLSLLGEEIHLHSEQRKGERQGEGGEQKGRRQEETMRGGLI